MTYQETIEALAKRAADRCAYLLEEEAHARDSDEASTLRAGAAIIREHFEIPSERHRGQHPLGCGACDDYRDLVKHYRARDGLDLAGAVRRVDSILWRLR